MSLRFFSPVQENKDEVNDPSSVALRLCVFSVTTFVINSHGYLHSNWRAPHLLLLSPYSSGPPRKKRRSKWDIQPDDLSSTPAAPANWEETTPTQGPTSTVAAIAAKLNAKLASEGKLKPASAVYMVSLLYTVVVCVFYPHRDAHTIILTIMSLSKSFV